MKKQKLKITPREKERAKRVIKILKKLKKKHWTGDNSIASGYRIGTFVAIEIIKSEFGLK